MPPSISIPSLGAALFTAAFTIGLAQAQTPAREVTRDELRVCMNNDSAMTARRQALELRSRQNREEAEAIRTESEALTQEQQRLVEDQRPMDKFDRKVKAHNARIKEARASAQALSQEADALNQAVLAHNESCGRVSFRPEDREAILKERETGAK